VLLSGVFLHNSVISWGMLNESQNLHNTLAALPLSQTHFTHGNVIYLSLWSWRASSPRDLLAKQICRPDSLSAGWNIIEEAYIQFCHYCCCFVVHVLISAQHHVFQGVFLHCSIQDRHLNPLCQSISCDIRGKHAALFLMPFHSHVWHKGKTKDSFFQDSVLLLSWWFRYTVQPYS